jgi:hypothetical protein
MKYRTRIYYSEEQKAEMWDRWQRGETINAIGRVFDRGHSSIAGQFERAGGIRPAARRRSRLALTLSEREEIFRKFKVVSLERATEALDQGVCTFLSPTGGEPSIFDQTPDTDAADAGKHLTHDLKSVGKNSVLTLLTHTLSPPSTPPLLSRRCWPEAAPPPRQPAAALCRARLAPRSRRQA